MKNYIIPLLTFILLYGCGNNATDKIKNDKEKKSTEKVEKTTSPDLVFNDGDNGPKIEFDMEVWEFGEINEGDVVDTVFTFKNVGNEPLIISNAKAGRGKFRAYPLYKEKPQLGDLVCYSRMSQTDLYDKTSSYKSHCDIVVKKTSDSIDVIGGNVNHTVGKKTVELNSDGTVKAGSAGKKWFTVIKTK